MAEAMKEENYTTEELNQMYDSGEMDGDEYDDLVTKNELASKSYMDLDPAVLDHAHGQGMIPEQDYNAAKSFQEGKTTYRLTDIPKGVAVGLANFAASTMNLAGEIYNKFDPEEKYERVEIEDRTHTAMGKVATVGTQIAAGWMSTAGVGAVVQAGAGTAKVATVLAKFPKTLKFVQKALPVWARGAATDLVAFDPYEGRMADMMEEMGAGDTPILKAYVHYMRTDKTNDATEERLKTALEGLLIGGTMEGAGKLLFNTMKLAKAKLWAKNLNDQGKVIKDLKNHPKLGEVAEAAEKQVDDEYEQIIGQIQAEAQRKKDTAIRQASLERAEHKLALAERGVDPGNPQSLQEVKALKSEVDRLKMDLENPASATPLPVDPKMAEAASELKVPNTTAERVKAFKIFDEVVEKDGSTVVAFADDMLKQVEGLTPGKHMFEAIVKASKDMIDKARGGPIKTRVSGGRIYEYRVGQTTTTRRSHKIAKDLGLMTGEADPQKVVDLFTKTYGAVKELPQHMLFMKEALTNWSNQLTQECQRIAKEGAKDDEMVNVMIHIQQLQEMQASLLGTMSSTGRTLNILSKKTGKNAWDFSGVNVQRMKAQLADDPKAVKEFIEKFSKIQDTASQLRAIRVAARTGWQEATEFAQMNALSGWRTHVRNIKSGFIMATSDSVMRSVVGLGRAAYFADRRELTAVAQLWSGIGHGFVSALAPGSWENLMKIPVYTLVTTFMDNPKILEKVLKDEKMGGVWKALITGDPQLDHVTKVRYSRGAGTHATNGPVRKGYEMLKRPIRRLSFDLLAAGDEAFKSMIYNGTLRSEAVDTLIATGRKQGGHDAFLQEVKSLLVNPPTDLMNSALKRAREITFQEDLPKNSLLARANSALNTAGPGAMAARLLGFLFFKTPVNILRATGRLTPMAALMQQRVRQNIAAGGVKAQMEYARQATGTMFIGGSAYLWATGGLTGKFPKDRRHELVQAGHKEYSIRIGDKWYSYKHLEPFATIMGAVANLMEASKHIEADEELEWASQDAAMELFAAIADPVVQNSYMKGFLELTKAFDDKSNVTKADKLRGTAELFIPATGFLNNIGDTTADDWQRETKTVFDRLQRKLNLFFGDDRFIRRHTITGEPLKRSEPWLSAGATSVVSDDPIDQEVVNLGITIKGWKEEFKDHGIKMELTRPQLEKLWDIYQGTDVKEVLMEELSDPDYQMEPEPIREKIIRKIVNGYRREAVGIFLDEEEGDSEAALAFSEKMEEWSAVLGGEVPFTSYKMKIQERRTMEEFIK